MDERERLREECQEDLQALRVEGLLSERAFRLLEKLVTRLDRLETGSFPVEERPTEPERRKSSTKWRNDGVLRELAAGKKDGDE